MYTSTLSQQAITFTKSSLNGKSMASLNSCHYKGSPHEAILVTAAQAFNKLATATVIIVQVTNT